MKKLRRRPDFFIKEYTPQARLNKQNALAGQIL